MSEGYCPTCLRVVVHDDKGRCRTCKGATRPLPKGWPKRQVGATK